MKYFKESELVMKQSFKILSCSQRQAPSVTRNEQIR